MSKQGVKTTPEGAKMWHEMLDEGQSVKVPISCSDHLNDAPREVFSQEMRFSPGLAVVEDHDAEKTWIKNLQEFLHDALWQIADKDDECKELRKQIEDIRRNHRFQLDGISQRLEHNNIALAELSDKFKLITKENDDYGVEINKLNESNRALRGVITRLQGKGKRLKK